ncbi:Oxidation resistance protein 1 [Pseudozyma hubeiensis]|nr:Oxidation resistance protein 1 [Pseudozyma hubeiensis]
MSRGSISESSGHARTESDGFGSFVDASSAFPSSFDPGLSEPLEDQTASSSVSLSSPNRTRAASPSPPARAIDEDQDDWAEADMVASFSPEEPHNSTLSGHSAAQTRLPSVVPTPASRPAAGRKVSGTGASSEWADWSSFLAAHTLPTQRSQSNPPQPSSSTKPTASVTNTTNPADDAFFDAFEVATNSNRAPSPPIIDLRGVEKQLEQKKQQQQKKNAPASSTTDDDFFSRFERAPQAALGRSSPLVLEPEQLESMHDARTSPMPASSSAPRDTDSYFGLAAQPQPINNGAGLQAHRDAGPGSLSPASPSSWTGSLRKTWTTLRGIQSEIANHLPSASDFIVPEEEVDSIRGAASHGVADSNPGGGLLIASDTPKGDPDEHGHEMTGRRSSASNGRASGTLPHASDYSQKTPFSSSSAASASGFSSGAAAPSAPSGSAPLRARDLFASSSSSALGAAGGAPSSSSSTIASGSFRRGPTHSSTAPISGAPGFDTASTRKWNTGHWTLDEKQKRSIPVTLSNRREETETVIESFHASRIQALLPPRLQLGKRWSLLYSLDQHGISLQTLYHRVAAGLDPMKVGRSVSGNQAGKAGEEDGQAEGWLRGASRETQQAMGTRGQTGGRRMHVGGGLNSISDAGLVIAIKDGDDNVFGAFVNEKLRPQQHYYGSGECFLWKTTAASSKEEDRGVERYKWTGKNDYMVLSESTFLSVGGGEGKFGLWIDGALEKGVSSCCPAFDNEILCDGEGWGKGRKEGEARFECYGLEVWAVGMD